METKKDILGREEFVNTLFDVMLRSSEKRMPISFAIDGAWGIGKSFVLDLLAAKLCVQQCEETQDNQFIVFRYNSWEYDFYEEPIIAIVAAMQDSLVEQDIDCKLENVKNQTLKTAVAALKCIANQLSINKLGIDCVEAINSLELSDSLDDAYSGVKKAISSIRRSLNAISNHKTIVLLIDELDRCLPEYAIKILNRCSHLFGGIPNLQVIYSINAVQLEQSVKSIFGDKMEMSSYLRKFYDCTFELANGKVECGIIERYQEYFSCFESDGVQKVEDDILSIIGASELDVRSIEKTMEKVQLAHAMLQTDIKDLALLLFEFVCAFTDRAKTNKEPLSFNVINRSGVLVLRANEYKNGSLVDMLEKLSAKGLDQTLIPSFGSKVMHVSSCENVYGRMVYCLNHTLGDDEHQIEYFSSVSKELVEVCDAFWDTFSLMK